MVYPEAVTSQSSLLLGTCTIAYLSRHALPVGRGTGHPDDVTRHDDPSAAALYSALASARSAPRIARGRRGVGKGPERKRGGGEEGQYEAAEC